MKRLTLTTALILACLCLAGESRSTRHGVVVLQTGVSSYCYETNGVWVLGNSGWTVYNADTSQGSPQVQGMAWVYDGSYHQTSPKISYAQVLADLLNDGFVIQNIMAGDQGQGQIVTLVR